MGSSTQRMVFAYLFSPEIPTAFATSAFMRNPILNRDDFHFCFPPMDFSSLRLVLRETAHRPHMNSPTASPMTVKICHIPVTSFLIPARGEVPAHRDRIAAAARNRQICICHIGEAIGMYPAAFAVKLVCAQSFQADGRAAMASNAHLRDMKECAEFPAAALAPQPEQPFGARHRLAVILFSHG